MKEWYCCQTYEFSLPFILNPSFQNIFSKLRKGFFNTIDGRKSLFETIDNEMSLRYHLKWIASIAHFVLLKFTFDETLSQHLEALSTNFMVVFHEFLKTHRFLQRESISSLTVQLLKNLFSLRGGPVLGGTVGQQAMTASMSY